MKPDRIVGRSTARRPTMNARARAKRPVTAFACTVIVDRLRTTATLAAAARRRPTEKAIHDLRVACRRAREAMAFFEGVPDVPALPNVARAARRMAKAVATMRENAVAIRGIEAMACRNVEIERTRRGVLAGLRRRRRSLAVARRERIATRALRLERTVADALPALSARATNARGSALWRFLDRRLAARKAKVVDRIRRLTPRPQNDTPQYAKLHRIRVAIKRWRYEEEIALFAAPGDGPRRDLLATLRRLQDAGGQTQDLADLMRIIPGEVRALGRPDAAGASGMLAELRHRRARAARAFVRMIGLRLGRGRQKS